MIRAQISRIEPGTSGDRRAPRSAEKQLSQQKTRPIAHVLEPLNALGNLFGNVSKWSQAGSEQKMMDL